MTQLLFVHTMSAGRHSRRNAGDGQVNMGQTNENQKDEV